MVELPKVSILIPLYNSESYISETIDSCLNQTYENIEIIIVDDGSTDNGLEIAKKYSEKFENILLETQKNSGAPVARNRAFSLSSGAYIQYLDADDLLHPEKIRLQMESLERENERTIAFGKWGTFKNSIDNVIWKDLSVNKDHNEPVQFLIELWANWISVITHSWLVPRILVDETGGWDESLVKNQDGDFFARVVMRANKLLYVADSLTYYRKDNDVSISKLVSKKTLEANLKTFETYMHLMKNDMDKSEVRKGLALMYSRYIDYVRHNYPENLDIIEQAKIKIKYLGFNKPLITKVTIIYYLLDLIGEKNIIRLKTLLRSMKI